MDKITIVFVHHTVKRGGGSEQVLYDIIHGLDRERFRPVLCCLYGLGELGRQLQDEGCVTYQNLVGRPYDPRNVARVAAVLRQEHADILFVSDAFHNVIVGRLAARQAGTPVSALIFHTYDTVMRQGITPSRRAMLEVADRAFYPQFGHVIALAETHKDYLISKKRIPARKIDVAYNGVDLRQFSAPVDRDTARAALQIPPGAQVVGIVAGLRRWKAHDMFLRAAAKVLAQMPDTFFILAGDGPERGRLEEMAQHLGIQHRVRFLGVVQNVPALLPAFDLSALSSIHEALPITLLEAMAAQRPIVATDVGSVAEIVEDGVNGFLAPSGDADRFAAGMMRLLNDPELARRFGIAGRKKVEQNFTVQRMVARYETLFTEWVDAGRRSAPAAHEGQDMWTPRPTNMRTIDDTYRK